MTAHISYGQAKQDSIDQFSIKQSLKCFHEQKSLKVIIEQKDSIIMAWQDWQKQTAPIKAKLIEENKALFHDNQKLKDKNETLKGKNYLLITALVIETIVLGIVIAF